jgi:DNA polymerase III sliding clamp (beta) subunit (PCNA family)
MERTLSEDRKYTTVTAQQDALLVALKRLDTLADEKHALLSLLHLTAAGEVVEMRVTDGNHHLSMSVPATVEVDTEAAGGLPLFIDLKRLRSAVSPMLGEVKLVWGRRTLVVSDADGAVKLQASIPGNYPPLPPMPNQHDVSIEPSELYRLLHGVLYAKGRTPNDDGAVLQSMDGKLTAIGCDGATIAIIPSTVETDAALPMEPIPHGALRVLNPWLKAKRTKGGEVSIAVEDRYWQVWGEDWRMVIRRVSGQFWRFDALLPQLKWDRSAVFTVAALKSGILRAGGLMDGRSAHNSVRLLADGDALSFKAHQRQVGTVKTSVPWLESEGESIGKTASGKELGVFLSVDKMKAAMGSMKAEKVTLHASPALDHGDTQGIPVKLVDEDGSIAIIAPMVPERA